MPSHFQLYCNTTRISFTDKGWHLPTTLFFFFYSVGDGRFVLFITPRVCTRETLVVCVFLSLQALAFLTLLNPREATTHMQNGLFFKKNARTTVICGGGESHCQKPATPLVTLPRRTTHSAASATIPQARRPPALPVLSESSLPPFPKSSTFSCTTTARPTMVCGPCKGMK